MLHGSFQSKGAQEIVKSTYCSSREPGFCSQHHTTQLTATYNFQDEFPLWELGGHFCHPLASEEAKAPSKDSGDTRFTTSPALSNHTPSSTSFKRLLLHICPTAQPVSGMCCTGPPGAGRRRKMEEMRTEVEGSAASVCDKMKTPTTNFQQLKRQI